MAKKKVVKKKVVLTKKQKAVIEKGAGEINDAINDATKATDDKKGKKPKMARTVFITESYIFY